VYVHVATAMHLGLRLEDHYPNLSGFCTRMRSRPSVHTTWPATWKPTPYTFLQAEPEL
jgi:hypothetical protein